MARVRVIASFLEAASNGGVDRRQRRDGSVDRRPDRAPTVIGGRAEMRIERE